MHPQLKLSGIWLGEESPAIRRTDLLVHLPENVTRRVICRILLDTRLEQAILRRRTIHLVRQRSKRKEAPSLLAPAEIKALIIRQLAARFRPKYALTRICVREYMKAWNRSSKS